jgi:beta-hydroxyacyl-ACP dehydratase FabZ
MNNEFDILKIQELLPHRYPFLLVDRIIYFEKDKKIITIKNVTINEPFFQGHFPSFPIMPGVLIIEAMAQSGGLLSLLSSNQKIEEGYSIFFMGIDKARFRNPVRPGDQLKIEVSLLRPGSKIAQYEGLAYVGEKLAAEASFTAMIGKK